MNSDQGGFLSPNSGEILPTSLYIQGHVFFLSFFWEYFLCVSSQGPGFFFPSVTLEIFVLILGKDNYSKEIYLWCWDQKCTQLYTSFQKNVSILGVPGQF